MVEIHLNLGCPVKALQEYIPKYGVGMKLTITKRGKVTLTNTKNLDDGNGNWGDADLKYEGYLVGPNKENILFTNMHVIQGNVPKQTKVNDKDFWYYEAKGLFDRLSGKDSDVWAKSWPETAQKAYNAGYTSLPNKKE